MKVKNAMIQYLIFFNILLIGFLIFNWIILKLNLVGIDENFMGMKFHSYRYQLSKIILFFQIIFSISILVSLFYKRSIHLKYILLFVSFCGLVLSWNAGDYFSPW